MTLRASIATDVVAAFAALSPPVPVDADPNTPFSPPADGTYAQLRFVAGAEVFQSIGGASSLTIEPLLAYVDIWTPQGTGDGLSTDLGDVAQDSMRRKAYPGLGRWKRFEAGPEGVEGTGYRRQVIGVFWRTRRK